MRNLRHWLLLAWVACALPGCRGRQQDSPRVDPAADAGPVAVEFPPLLPEAGGDVVVAVASSADSGLLAAASARGLTLWSLPGGRLLAVKDLAAPSAMAWAPSARKLAVASGGSLVVFDHAPGAPLRQSARVEVGAPVLAVGWRDSERVLVALQDGGLREYAGEPPKPSQTRAPGVEIERAVFERSTARVALVPRGGGGLFVRELAAGTEVTIASGLRIGALALPPVGRRIAAVDSARPRTVLLWETERVAQPRSVPVAVDGDIDSLAWLPDGSRLAVTAGGQVAVIDVRTGAQSARLALATSSARAVDVSPDGHAVVVGSAALEVFDARGALKWRSGGAAEHPHGVACSRTAVALLDASQGLSLIDFAQRRVARIEASAAGALALAWPEPRRIDVAWPTRVQGIYPISGGQERAVALTGVAETLVFSANGRVLAGTMRDESGLRASVWQRSTGARKDLGPAEAQADFAFSPSADEIAITTSDAIAVHAVSSGQPRRRIRIANPGNDDRGQPSRPLAWSAAGDLFAVAGPERRGVELFDAQDGVRARHLPLAVAPVVFSPDGAWLADRDGRWLDARSGAILVQPEERPALRLQTKQGACFAPDGSWAVFSAHAGVVFVRRGGQRLQLVRVPVGAMTELVAIDAAGRFEGSDAALANLILHYDGARRRALDLPRFRSSGLMVLLPAR